MKRVIFLLLIGSALGYLIAPQMADALPPCCCAVSCGWSCEPSEFFGWVACEQDYPKAEQNNSGQGIPSSSQCGSAMTGEGCDTAIGWNCGGSAYTVAACDSSS